MSNTNRPAAEHPAAGHQEPPIPNLLRGGDPMIGPDDLNRPPEWWAGYAAGHEDGTAEAQLLIDAADRAGYAAGRRDEKHDADAQFQAGPTDIRSCVHFLEYLAQDPAPRPVPPLDHVRRPAA